MINRRVVEKRIEKNSLGQTFSKIEQFGQNHDPSGVLHNPTHSK